MQAARQVLQVLKHDALPHDVHQPRHVAVVGARELLDGAIDALEAGPLDPLEHVRVVLGVDPSDEVHVVVRGEEWEAAVGSLRQLLHQRLELVFHQHRLHVQLVESDLALRLQRVHRKQLSTATHQPPHRALSSSSLACRRTLRSVRGGSLHRDASPVGGVEGLAQGGEGGELDLHSLPGAELVPDLLIVSQVLLDKLPRVPDRYLPDDLRKDPDHKQERRRCGQLKRQLGDGQVLDALPDEAEDEVDRHVCHEPFFVILDDMPEQHGRQP